MMWKSFRHGLVKQEIAFAIVIGGVTGGPTPVVGQIAGVVLDQFDRPVDRAEVRAEFADDTLIISTGADGRFVLGVATGVAGTLYVRPDLWTWPTRVSFVSPDTTLVVPVVVGIPLAQAKRLLARNERARQKWEASRPRAYRYRFATACFCFGGHQSVLVEVNADGSVAVMGSDYYDEEFDDPYEWTIDALFGYVLEAIDKRHDEIKVVYHPQYGFPQMFYQDWRFWVHDDDFRFSVVGFEPLYN